MAFKPLHDRVLVRRVEGEEKTAGGLIIPDSAKEKPAEGVVVAVGDGVDEFRIGQRVACGGNQFALCGKIDAVMAGESMGRAAHPKMHPFDAEFAQGLDPGHVDLVESGQQGRCLLRLHQTLGDAPADGTHGHHAFAALAGRCGCRHNRRPDATRARYEAWKAGRG